jgi:hypothetical protein
MTVQGVMDPRTETFYNEQGKKGKADGLFSVDHGQYTVVLLAEKRWRTPSGKRKAKRVMDVIAGATARDLAKALRAKGWAPPRKLARLCECAPRQRVSRR